jgi:hypothetical protein
MVISQGLWCDALDCRSNGCGCGTDVSDDASAGSGESGNATTRRAQFSATEAG